MKRASLVRSIAFATTSLLSSIALAAPIDGAGSIATCPQAGKILLKPALVTGGSGAGAVKLVIKSSGACSGGSGDGATIVGFHAKSAGTTAANTCAAFGGTSSSDLAWTFKWKVSKGSPKLSPSTATFSLQPGALSTGGNQTLDLAGTITAGSFTGSTVTAHIESDETAATLLGDCDAKGIKKIAFGADGATSSCMNGPNLAAAITSQSTTIDGNDVPHLALELTTLTTSPFELTATGLSNYPAGMVLDSISSTCAAEPGHFRCRHTANFRSSGACEWDGDYAISLSYACSPTNTCDLCGATLDQGFTLDTENFCTAGTVFCSSDLSCAAATAGASSGGVPCCSSTYAPLNSCMSDHCAADCAAAIHGTAGIVPASPCYDCVFSSCNSEYSACSADNEVCAAP